MRTYSLAFAAALMLLVGPRVARSQDVDWTPLCFPVPEPPKYSPKVTSTSHELKAELETLLGGKILQVTEYAEKQFEGDYPRVTLLIDRGGKPETVTMQAAFDDYGRLLSVRLALGKAYSGWYDVTADPVECAHYCLNKCNDIFCYTYCWYVCVLN